MRRLSLIVAAVLVAAGSSGRAATKPSPRPSPSPSASPSPRPSPRTYTEEDLKKAGGNVQTIGSAPASPTPEEARAAAKAEESASYREKTWRARAEGARANVTAAESKIAAVQSEIDALRSDLTQAGAMDPNREQNRQASIAKATHDLEEAKAGLEAARKAQVDLEDEARREGVPPGWLRP